MPLRVHSSSKLNHHSNSKRNSNHLTLVSPTSSTTNQQASSPSLQLCHPASGTATTTTATTTQSTLVANHPNSRSKSNVVKKRQNGGLSRNNTSVTLAKSSFVRKPHSSAQHKSAIKKGAFKGALDADLDQDEDYDEEDLHRVKDSTTLELDRRRSSQLKTTQITLTPQQYSQANLTVSQPKEDEAWVSEPSTRSGTPTRSSQLPQLCHETSDLPSSPHCLSSQPQLDLQLPNPLSLKFLPPLPCSSSTPNPQSLINQSSPSQQPLLLSTSTPPSSAPTAHSTAPMSEFKPGSETRGRSKNRNQLNDSVQRARYSASFQHGHQAEDNLPIEVIPKEITPQQHTQSSPKAVLLPPSISPPQSKSDSLQQCSLKGKGKASPESISSLVKTLPAKRTSLNSVRSLSSLVIFHNDALMNRNPHRLSLKRVESAASFVLPPKVDTTEAVITLNSKASFYPTLQSISDLPPESSLNQSSPRSSTPSRSPVATTSANPTPTHYPQATSSEVSEPKVQPNRLRPWPSSTNLPPPHTLPLDQSEFARRLKKYSNATGQAPYINLKAANETTTTTGLMSSLLSPRVSFKPKPRSSGPHPSNQGDGLGYFDGLKNLVGINSSNENVAADGSRSKQKKSSPHGSSNSGIVQAGPSSSLPKDSTIDIHLNGVRYPFTHSPNLNGLSKSVKPKPIVPGIITTCGPVPVLSKFLGPRPVVSFNQPPIQSTSKNEIRVEGRSQNPSNESIKAALHPSTPPAAGLSSDPNTDTHKLGSPLRKKTGAETTGSLTQIQRKLLMERDRPISPTLFDEPLRNSCHYGDQDEIDRSKTISTSLSSSTGGSNGQMMGLGNHTTLPPPSYLIRSLGGQTGPLPLIPINLMPTSSQPAPTSSLAANSTSSTTGVLSNPTGVKQSGEKRNMASPSKNGNLIGISPRASTGVNQNELDESRQMMMAANPSSSLTTTMGNRLNEPALKAKQALSIKLWRNSLIDEVEQVLTDHESNTRFRNPLFESLIRISSAPRRIPS